MTERIPPVRRQIVVPVPPAVAFEVWTAQIHQWWPLGDGHSVYGDGGTVGFVDGQLVEESPLGRAVWGTVVEWSPPERLRMTWHPGQGPDRHSDLSLHFVPIGDGSRTLVTLEHSGWERLDGSLARRSAYAGGWLGVVAEYASSFSGAQPVPADGDVWLVLVHTPGVAAPPEGVLSAPGIRDHVAFVSRLGAEGVVVAAGPFAGGADEGMTVIRVAPDRVADYVERSQTGDASVTSGLLQVTARIWRVMIPGS